MFNVCYNDFISVQISHDVYDKDEELVEVDLILEADCDPHTGEIEGGVSVEIVSDVSDYVKSVIEKQKKDGYFLDLIYDRDYHYAE